MPVTRVLIVDDSALMRQMLTEMLRRDGTIEVVGTAADPYIAREKIKQLNPDVLTLDVEMPRMDGLTFLRNLMRLRPMPVVMVSTLTEKGATITLQALELGAVDFIAKPKVESEHGWEPYADDLIAKVKMAAGVRVRELPHVPDKSLTVEPKLTVDAVLPLRKRPVSFQTTEQIVALGASTGGTEAIRDILSRLPADAPAMVITQHMPKAFIPLFAKRLDTMSAMRVQEAQHDQPILSGHAYIAPGECHLLVVRCGSRYHCRLQEGPLVNRHRPSVDVMFRSVAQTVGSNAVGVVLTGMGDDGACGLKEMHDAGASTLVQDERTSVVWGMPGEAVKRGGVDMILPLGRIPDKILVLTRGQHPHDAVSRR